MTSRNVRLWLGCCCRLNIRQWDASSAYITFCVSEDMQGGLPAQFQATLLAFAGKGWGWSLFTDALGTKFIMLRRMNWDCRRTGGVNIGGCGFLGAFVKLRKWTVCFALSISVCRSVFPHGTTRLPLDGFFFFNLVYEALQTLTNKCTYITFT